MPKKKTYTIKSPFSPFLFRGPETGKLFIMPNWVEVPEGTTMDQVIHIKPEIMKVEVVKQFKSSKGDVTYNVTFNGKEYRCDCPGARFRNRNCKHIKQVI
jgi:uncharacterized protein YprB with RNaseH-like and TPR domain